MSIKGALDKCDQRVVSGWITAVNGVQSLDLLLEGKVVAQCAVDQFREDLRLAGFGDGRCAFSLQVPGEITESDCRRLRVRLTGTELYLELPRAPEVSVVPEKINGVVAPDHRFVSRFGGLWIDRDDWVDKLGELARSGKISAALVQRVFQFVLNGYVILPRAVSSEIVDQINDDVDNAWRKAPPGVYIETFEPDNAYKIIRPDPRWRAGRTKLLDLYTYSAAARKAIAAPEVISFLRLIFGEIPRAFQSLNFWYGSQQDIHKDSAYVRVDGNPMALAASWIALEDLEPGIGELEYYEGSHRAPDYLFGGVAKWMEGEAGDFKSEQAQFLASLAADAKKYSHRRTSFVARKGDVLIWHADLAHGGSKIIKPNRTRRSLVTHYCPASLKPFYCRDGEPPEQLDQDCLFMAQPRK